MLSRLLQKLLRPLGPRPWSFQVGMALVVALTAAAAFLLAYGALQFSLWRGFQERDRNELDRRLLAYWAIWQAGGPQAVLERAAQELRVYGSRPFLLILEGQEEEALGAVIPGGWEAFDLSKISKITFQPGQYEILSTEELDYALVITGLELEDGHRLLAGLSTENLEVLGGLYLRNLPWVFVVILAAGFIVGVLATQRFLSPLHRLNEEIDKIIATGELSRRLPSLGTGDQLDGLIGRFNRLLTQVESLIGGMKETLDATAHDLRTPLTRIRGRAELALGEDNKSQRQEAFLDIVEHVDQVVNLLEALMEIAEAERGLLSLNLHPCDLADLAQEVVNLYRFVAEEKNIDLTLALPLPARILGDPVRLRQVLGNLVDNALKYSPPGSRVNLRGGTKGDKAWMEVTDAGPGVSPAERERIFDRLYRGDKSRGSRGLGLGLSLVKALTEAHRGQVSVGDREGGGSCFRLEFPIITKT